jgi:phage terminase large subunit GpA-like protein
MSQKLTQQQQHLVNHLKKPIQALKPPPRLSVSEWADQKRRLDSQTSSEPGRWHTSRAEYQRGIMDACSDPEIREVVVMAGAQLGKSEAILNIIGYHIENDPSPILVLQPTVEMAQSFSKDRVANGLIRSTPCLREKVKDPRSRDSGNTTLHKVFPGGALTLVGANSPAGLASRPIRLVLCDEVDRYPTSAGSEGDPIQLARKRANTFWNRKIVMVSTPTNKGASRIEEAFEESDQRYFYVPCKHCHHEQKLVWQNVRWNDDDPDSASYMCIECGVLWTDSDRRWAIRNGRWVGEAEFKGVAGFCINGLYSPWTPLADGVRDFLSMKKNPEQLRVWTNTYLGESWEDQGETVDDFSLYERREDYQDAVPEEVVFLTAGVDVQDNRLEISVVGWARDQESYVIDHQTMYGDPSTPQLWGQLDSFVNKIYETFDGRQMAIRATCIDSGGHFTNSVYQYAKKNAGNRVFAIKGVGGEGKPIAGRPSKNNIARCPLFPVGVDTAKDLLFARMRITEPGAGYIHFNSHLDDEYFRQLTAEKVVTRFHRGFKKRVFQKMRARNEALDCFVYAIAAYSILNVDINTLADKVKLKDNVAEKISSEAKARPKKPPFVPRTGSGFVNSWR